MPLNKLIAHRPSVRAYPERKHNSWLPMASVFRRATDERDVSAAGHWGSGSLALTMSLRRCGATPYTSSSVPRFTNRLLSPLPFGFRLVVHLGVIALNSGQLCWQFTQCVTRRTVSAHPALPCCPNDPSSITGQTCLHAGDDVHTDTGLP